MGIGAKLKRLDAPSGAAANVDDDFGVESFRKRIRQTLQQQEKRRVARRKRTGELFAGEVVQTPLGCFVQRTTRHPKNAVHGAWSVSAMQHLCTQAMARIALDPNIAQVDPSKLLFVDTETTGLAGGMGTVPFVVGAGYLHDGCFVVEQLVMRDYAEEAPMLRRLCELFRERPVLVTYNGKSFDWPLLRNRFVLHRLAPAKFEHHIDMLHCARRLLKHRVESLRLVHLEEHLLGFVREEDIAGFEIPQVFFDYLHDGDGTRMEEVVRHNAWDIVSLAGIAAHLCHQMTEPARVQDPRDVTAFAQLAARHGDEALALSFITHHNYHVLEEQHLAQAVLFGARLLQRAGRYGDAVEILEDALERIAPRTQRMAAVRLRLAKLYEHKLRDVQQAAIHARYTARAEGKAAQTHRLARLKARLRRIGN